jgi:hypothetical protein
MARERRTGGAMAGRDRALERRLNAWLRAEVGVETPRRVVREEPGRILVSKFAAGFAQRLHRTLERLPRLFEVETVAAVYRRLAAARPEAGRVATWRAAALAVLDEGAGPAALTAVQRAEVRAGIDSVAAVLETVLWSGPRAGDTGYRPLPGEVAAYRDALTRAERAQDLFTRVYGTFEGAAVVNYCPGAPYARALLAQAWTVCTGTAPPC